MNIKQATRFFLSVCLFIFFLFQHTMGQIIEQSVFQYISPVPDSKYNLPGKTIALRHGEAIDAESIQGFEFSVVGSESGNVQGKTILSDDGRTLIFKPLSAFKFGEIVHVKTLGELTTQSGLSLKNVDFSFYISSQIPALPQDFVMNSEFEQTASLFPHSQSDFAPKNKAVKDNNLPEDFPELTVEVLNATFDNGYYFVSPFGHWGWFPDNVPYTIIFDDQGIPVYYQKQASHCYDFKKNENGMLSYLYNEWPVPHYKIMNSSYEVVDTYAMPQGLVTDFHEFLMTEENHVFIMAYDPQIVDMSEVVPDGVEDAVVIGWIIHELDASKNLVFEWRSWDHYNILDAEGYVNLLASTIDLFHGNAIEIVDENALLLSPRNLNEITKIDRNTGEIIWRLNGNNNMFEFVNDSLDFSWQHDCRIISNGNLTIFDNGTYHPDPKFSSMVEYEMDEEDYTATLVRRVRNNPDILGIIMGSSREVQNGNVVMGWGSGVPGISEFNADGQVTASYYFAGVNYRAYRYPWATDYFEVSESELNYGYIWKEDQKTKDFKIINNQDSEIQISSYFTHLGKFTIDNEFPIVLQPGELVTVWVTFTPGEEGSFSDVLTLNSDINSNELVQRIAQQVELVGHATEGQGVDGSDHVKIVASPNPVKGNLKITFEKIQEKVNVSVLSYTGQKVREALWLNVSSGIIDMSSLPSGIYFIELRNSNMELLQIIKTIK